MALRRLYNTKKRLRKNPEIAEAYSENINQYLEKGYIHKIDPTEEKPARRWYLPHFPVVRLDRVTTKTRIVFDASAKRHPVALICDIAEMYLRIEVAPKDRLCQRFLWRSLDQQRKPEEYEFNRVVFGINSSPFQAQFVSQTHAEKHKDELPLAAEAVSKSTYMDDSMDSVIDDSQGIELYKQLDELWNASQDAYGAVVYLRVSYESGSVSSRLVVAKTRVAPLAATSIPRLELIAAILGLRLTESVSRVYSGGLAQAVFWSDSMNVLWWIRGRSRIFKPFVANRVGEIQSLTNPKHWRFVPTNDNPADFTTRGMKVSDMVKEKKWWSGPDFLQKEESDWPVNQIDTCKVSEATEIKKAAQGSTQTGRSNGDWTVISVHEDDQPWRLDPSCFSSWTKLIRVQAWVRRFVDNCRSPNRESGELKAEEIEDVAIQVIKGAQRKAYPDEYLALQRQRELPKKSKLLGLQPWLDEEGQVRCDGRLKYAEFLPQDARFPIILPRKNCVTNCQTLSREKQSRRWNKSTAGGFINSLLDHFWS
ncbi:uncharacterized protein LOC122962848 [Acropora millepora]|uniref:uncharacterized protein LOC122962848 n=2 Tax=Acropora TaxID=6127 RepID=UPI001CF0E2D0|nr:uncharacterized protein LOC122962848 [Acropora millepora]